MHQLLFAILVAPANPVVKYFFKVFHKDPFRGIYQPNAFDLSILIPYFTILIILAMYGIHRYCLVYLYMKNRGKAPQPLRQFEVLPRVTIQLPIFNERYVVERLLETVTRIDYPRELLEIQVLDDSTDETCFVSSRLVSEYASAGHPITYHHRDHREGFKAGALAEGMKTATGEFIAIFDADFAPPPQILRQMVHYFTDSQVAVVQGRWTWINRHYSNLSEVEAILLDGHFVIEHGGRNFSGRFFNFNGTAGMWRRAAIDDAGGWQHDTLTEDTDLSYRAQLKGWKFVYAPDIICPSELPVEMNSFKTQQARWAKGSDPGGEENPSPGVAQRPTAGHQDGGHVPSDREHCLPADDRFFGDSAAGYDRTLLPGLVSDAVSRSATILGLHLFDFEFLPGGTTRALSAKMAQPHKVHAVRYGDGHRFGRQQWQGGDGSIDR